MAQTLTQIRELLESRGLAPRKRLGQNFLVDHNLIAKLVNESRVGEGDLVLEVGPGTGTLTEELLDRGCEVVACELDRGLASLIRDRLGAHARFTLIEGDCLASKRQVSQEIIERLGGRPFRLVANLPYGAATPLMIALLAEHPECAGLYVTIQREVGDRLGAGAGTDAYGSISVIAQSLATVRTIAKLPSECFWPRPDVASVMTAIERRTNHGIDDPRALAAFCQRVFEKRRKQLGGVLGRGIDWPEGVEPTQRAESLSPDLVVALWRSVRNG